MTFWTISHSSFDFNFFAFNPWELYTQGYKNNKKKNKKKKRKKKIYDTHIVEH